MQITIIGQKLSITDTTLVSRSVGIYTASFTFDDSWDGYSKTAVFQLGIDNPIEVVIEDGECLIPHEVLTRSGHLTIGVYGTNGAKVKPTVWGKAKVVLTGTPTGSIGTEPTPSIYAQILAVADEAKATAEDAYDRAVTAQDSAQASAELAEHYAEVAQQGAEESGYAWFEVNEEDGEMYVTITPNLDEDIQFSVNTSNGTLEVIV